MNVRPERILVLSTVESLALFPFSCTLPFYAVMLLMYWDHTFLVISSSSILKKERLL